MSVVGPALAIQKPHYHDKDEAECREIIAKATPELERLNLRRRIYDLRVDEGHPEPARGLDNVANFDGEAERLAMMIQWAANRIAAIRSEAEGARQRAERAELLRRLEREYGIKD